MKILFTCHSLKEFAGTEMVTLSLSNYFLERNWDVDIFTIDFGLPFSEILNCKVNVYTIDNCDKLKKEYDIIWGHQYPTLDYILFHKKVKGKRVYYEALSFYMPIEAFPVYYKDLTLNGVVSENVKKHLLEIGYDTDKMFVMTNYATSNYFDYTESNNDIVSKIAVVSNHVPTELEDFKEIAANHNIQVDIFGMHHTYKFIDEKLLSNYDVIISIGKTVFYALAMGIPSYCYDKGVSVGYIHNKNFDENLKTNFALRDVFSQKTAEVILNEILKDYQEICIQTKELKRRAKQSFYFDDLIDNLMKQLVKKNEMDYEYLYDKYPTLNFTSRLYIEDIGFWKKEAINWFQYSEVLKKDLEDKNKQISDILNSNSWKIADSIRRFVKRDKTNR